MEDSPSLFKFPSVFRRYWLALSLGLAGLMFLIYGLISLLAPASKSPAVTFTSNQNKAANVNKIAVDIEGAVIKPGVYKLNQDSIIQDAFVASGGLSDEADREYVSKNINLAAKLSDGSKIYVPKKGENPPQNQVLGDNTTNSGLININTASSTELDSLPGIGPVTSEKIISSRPYSSINDLLDKKVVSSKVFTQIKDKVSIY